MNIENISIRWKVIGAMVLLTVVAIAVYLVVSYRSTLEQLERSERSDMHAVLTAGLAGMSKALAAQQDRSSTLANLRVVAAKLQGVTSLEQRRQVVFTSEYYRALPLRTGLAVAQEAGSGTQIVVGYRAIGARNPDEEAQGFEQAALQNTRSNGEPFTFAIDWDGKRARAFWAIAMQPGQLQHFGSRNDDPDGSGYDDLGFPMEGWKSGEYHNGYLAEHDISAQYDDVISHFITVAVGLLLGGVAAALVLGWFIARILVRALQEPIRVADAIAGGDLTVHFDTNRRDETGPLLRAFGAMHTQLRDVVGRVSGAAEDIRNSAEETARGNTDLSQRTETQASSLEETAASMEEMTSTVQNNANNAAQANELASNARQQAEQGRSVVGEAMSAMQEINASSNKIADIIGVIDEIAFQTNLLALNAAVEAARAGEQGRGFAVVAAEVRNLAQRSAESAKEIKALIQDSVDKVEKGSGLVEHSGTTLTQILESIKKVSDVVAEISAASNEQSEGIQQVNTAVMQMDEMTQQNAALVEQASAVSRAMEEQAREMVRTIEFFRV